MQESCIHKWINDDAGWKDDLDGCIDGRVDGMTWMGVFDGWISALQQCVC